jgi:hypothetical protein
VKFRVSSEKGKKKDTGTASMSSQHVAVSRRTAGASASADMSSTVTKKTTSKYVYRSTGGQGADISIEYGTDMGALTRLEVTDKFTPSSLLFFHTFFSFSLLNVNLS